MELISRQYTVENETERMLLLNKRKKMIDWFVNELDEAIILKDLDRIEATLEDLFLETIGSSRAQIWVNRINNNETNLESFKRLYLLMAEYGFRPYHT